MNLKSHLPRELPETGYKSTERQAINALIRAMRRLEPISTPSEKVTIGPNGTSRKSLGGEDGTNTNNLPRWL